MFRLLFFGTPAFAVASFNALMESHHEVIGVVTQPDRPRGRGHVLTPGPIKLAAQAHQLPVWQPTTLKDAGFLDLVRSLEPDLGIVAAYGKILPEVLLHIPRFGMLNVHASLLPHYRGAAPINRAIIAGDAETGVTIMRVVKELDAGPMLARAVQPIAPSDTSVEVEAALAGLGATLLVDTLDRLSAGSVTEVPQDANLATFAPRLTKEEGLIDWAMPASALHNRVRGLQPWPMAYTFLADERVLIHQTAVDTPSPADVAARAPGLIVASGPEALRVACGEGTALRILVLQLQGRRPMPVRELLAGHRILPGATFRSSPPP